MDEKQFAEATTGKIVQSDVQVREVSNGFILNAVRRFLDPQTKGVVLAQNIEGVAASAEDAIAAVTRFYADGTL